MSPNFYIDTCNTKYNLAVYRRGKNCHEVHVKFMGYRQLSLGIVWDFRYKLTFQCAPEGSTREREKLFSWRIIHH